STTRRTPVDGRRCAGRARSRRIRQSCLPRDAGLGALTLPRAADSAKALDLHRIAGQSCRVVQKRVQYLEVAGGRHVEALTDRVILGTAVFLPPPLELQNGHLERSEEHTSELQSRFELVCS